jgi:quinol monooxygenase YgiN
MSEVENTLTLVLWEAKPKPGREAELKAFVTNAVTRSRHDAGCIDYAPHEIKGRPGTFVIQERWICREALEAHFTRRIQELVPQLLKLIDGSIKDGIRLLRPCRPA